MKRLAYVQARRLAWLLLLFVAGKEPLLAHQRTDTAGRKATGLVIPTITHGQMLVIAENRAAILALSQKGGIGDAVQRQLENYIQLQYFACFRGLVPGSITDEASPFNECAHATLAATRALYMHLRERSGDHADVQALGMKIEREMLENNASLALCRYSDEGFDTGEVLAPHWADISTHFASCMTLIVIPAGLAGCGWMLTCLLRRRRAAGM